MAVENAGLNVLDLAISAILEDDRGDLWIGTDPGGLNRLDRRTGTFRYYRSRSEDPTTVRSDAVNALYQDSRNDRLQPRLEHSRAARRRRDGEMLIGTWHGADFFDRGTGRFTRLAARYPEAGMVGTYAAAEDGEGNIWLARSNGALHIDHASGG